LGIPKPFFSKTRLSSLKYQEEKAAQLCEIGSALLPDIERASSHGYFGVLVNEIGTNQFYLANIGTRPSKEMLRDDIFVDAALVLDKDHAQYRKAIEFASFCRDKYFADAASNACITTGHSKGMPLSQLQAYYLGAKCHGFEGPFLSAKIRDHYVSQGSRRDNAEMVSFLSNANLINGVNSSYRVGRIFYVDPLVNQNLGDKPAVGRILSAHSMVNIIEEIKQERFYSSPQEPCVIQKSFMALYAESRFLMKQPGKSDAESFEVNQEGFSITPTINGGYVLEKTFTLNADDIEALQLNRDSVAENVDPLGSSESEASSSHSDNTDETNHLTEDAKTSSPVPRRNESSESAVKFDIKNVKIIPTADGTGIAVGGTIDNNDTEVSIGIGAGGAIIVGVKIELGAGFVASLATAGIALGVGAVIAGVVVTAQHIYRQHQHHIEHKASKSVRCSVQDLNHINRNVIPALTYTINQHEQGSLTTERLLQAVNSNLRHFNEKQAKLENRAEYAGTHKKMEARNELFSGVRDLYHLGVDIQKAKLDIQAHDTAKNTVAALGDIDPEQIMSAIHDRLGKPLTKQAFFELSLLREKLVANIVEVKNIDEAKALLQKSEETIYYAPGDLSSLRLGSGYGTFDSKTLGDLTDINKKISAVNDEISCGNNPTDTLTKIIGFIDTKLTLWGSSDRKGKRHKVNSKSSDYVSCQQWDARIQALQDLRATLVQQRDNYKTSGNQPILVIAPEQASSLRALVLHEAVQNSDSLTPELIAFANEVKAENEANSEIISWCENIEASYQIQCELKELHQELNAENMHEAYSMAKLLKEKNPENEKLVAHCDAVMGTSSLFIFHEALQSSGGLTPEVIAFAKKVKAENKANSEVTTWCENIEVSYQIQCELKELHQQLKSENMNEAYSIAKSLKEKHPANEGLVAHCDAVIETSYLKDAEFYSHTIGLGSRIVGNYLSRYGSEGKQRFFSQLSGLYGLSPTIAIHSLQYPFANDLGDAAHLSVALEKAWAKQLKTLKNPLGSIGKVTRSIDLVHKLAMLSPLGSKYRKEMAEVGQVVYGFNAYLTGIKMLAYIEKGKSLAKFSTFALDLGVDLAFKGIEMLSGDGNLPEEILFYVAPDGAKILGMTYMPAALCPPALGAMLLVQLVYTTYAASTGVYNERAYHAMMSNASYHIKREDYSVAGRSVDKLDTEFARAYDGLTYRNEDSHLIKGAKAFVIDFRVTELTRKIDSNLCRINLLIGLDSNANERQISTHKTKVLNFNKTLMKITTITQQGQIRLAEYDYPLHFTINVCLIRLQNYFNEVRMLDLQEDASPISLIATPGQFIDDFNRVMQDIADTNEINAENKATFRQAMTSIARQARVKMLDLAVICLQKSAAKYRTVGQGLLAESTRMMHLQEPADAMMGSELYLKQALVHSLLDTIQDAHLCLDAIPESDRNAQYWLIRLTLVKKQKTLAETNAAKTWFDLFAYRCYERCVTYIDTELESIRVNNEMDAEIKEQEIRNKSDVKASLVSEQYEIESQITLNHVALDVYGHIERATSWSELLKDILCEQTITANFEDTCITFSQEYMPGDGDCALHALGITRIDAVDLLLGAKSNEIVRRMVAYDIKAGILQRTLPADMLSHYDRHIGSNILDGHQLNDFGLYLYCSSEDAYVKYIHTYVSQPGSWFEYSLSYEDAEATLDAIAFLMRKNIRIWQRSPGKLEKLQLSHHRNFDSEFEYVDLFYVNMANSQSRMGQNHFNQLVIREQTNIPRLVNGNDSRSTQLLTFVSSYHKLLIYAAVMLTVAVFMWRQMADDVCEDEEFYTLKLN
jgi:hypothetical protein